MPDTAALMCLVDLYCVVPECTGKNLEDGTPFNFDTPPTVTLLYLYYWYFYTPPKHLFLTGVIFPVLYGKMERRNETCLPLVHHLYRFSLSLSL
jgi:hypothetical protein